MFGGIELISIFTEPNKKQLRQMTIQELKKALTEMKPALKAVKFLDVKSNERDGKYWSLRYTNLSDFGNKIIDLNEDGFTEFEIKEVQLGYEVKATKTFPPKTMNELIGEGNYGC